MAWGVNCLFEIAKAVLFRHPTSVVFAPECSLPTTFFCFKDVDSCSDALKGRWNLWESSWKVIVRTSFSLSLSLFLNSWLHWIDQRIPPTWACSVVIVMPPSCKTYEPLCASVSTSVKWDNSSYLLIELLRGLNELVCIKSLKQCLTCSKYYDILTFNII